MPKTRKPKTRARQIQAAMQLEARIEERKLERLARLMGELLDAEDRGDEAGMRMALRGIDGYPQGDQERVYLDVCAVRAKAGKFVPDEVLGALGLTTKKVRDIEPGDMLADGATVLGVSDEPEIFYALCACGYETRDQSTHAQHRAECALQRDVGVISTV